MLCTIAKLLKVSLPANKSIVKWIKNIFVIVNYYHSKDNKAELYKQEYYQLLLLLLLHYMYNLTSNKEQK